MGLIAGEEIAIQQALREWREYYDDQLNSQASHQLFEAECLRRLRDESDKLSAHRIANLARGGLAAADHALRIRLKEVSQGGGFDALPAAARDYNMWAMEHPELPIGYPSRASHVVSDFIRDTVICRAMDWLVAQYRDIPIPLCHSTQRSHSAAFFVGDAFKIGETRARQIYRGMARRPEEFAAFVGAGGGRSQLKLQQNAPEKRRLPAFQVTPVKICR